MSGSPVSLALSSDFPSTAHPDLVTCIKAVDANPRIAWVAPESIAAKVRFPLASVAFRAYGFNRLEHVAADRLRSSSKSALEHFDVVYLTGGEPLSYRHTLHQTGLAELLPEFVSAGRLVVASSGGAMQLTPNVSLYRLRSSDVDGVMATRDEFSGLNLVSFELLPHLNRHDPAFLEKVRRYSERIPNDIVALDDGAAILSDRDGGVRCVGTGARYRRGVQGPFGSDAH